MKPDPSQLDFWHQEMFPVRVPAQHIDIDRYRAKIKRAMARAIKECAFDRATIVARMAQYLGLANISKAALDAYTAESKTGHDVTLIRFAAFVHATGALWLWDEVASVQGVTVLIGDEARLAEIARLRQERQRIEAEIRRQTARPVTLTSRGRA
ncbi:hypothetical protein AM571_CH03283 [Rhizobium etli 8C-3]|uniref:Uncharacterized protein n=2 Tax=Rhizobium TaxID=379 RepID=A0A1L5P7A9_RHIET|nr:MULTISPECIES: hypothetical protein [Rhizobium]APO76077.1 hypothetical protein AM571_CH03283 [Rhizobium etli 8C-3]TCU35418.1 hypothetical protein EV129_1098 [Rhizobium azibense]